MLRKRATSNSKNLARLLNRLVAFVPTSTEAGRARLKVERALLEIVKAGGKRAADAAIKAVRLGKTQLSRIDNLPRISRWRATLGTDAPVLLDLWFSAGQIMQATYVQYGAPPAEPRLTPAQRARHEMQQAFYARYTEIGQRWYRGRGPRRLPVWDNCILLIGELEADVNNGGFSQYLDNKGLRRARSALAALRTVGALKTAGMLKAAMASGVREHQLSLLDARFYKVPEDLAVLTMHWVRRRES